MTEQVHTMRAVLAKGPETVGLGEVPRPRPKPGEVLVAVEAAGITADELSWPDWSAFIPSHEISGVVVEAGEGVADPAVDAEVYGLIGFDRDGGASEFVAVAADLLAPKPGALDHLGAASLPLAALTAWQALVDHAELAAGQRVLVHGGAGGVGNYLVQVAAALGAEVTATASAADADYVRDLGATTVIDYRTAFEDQVSGMDVVVDTKGGDVLDRSWSVLRPGGILVAVATAPAEGAAEAHGVRGVYFVVEPNRAQLLELNRLVDEGRLRAQVGKVYRLDDAAAAFVAVAGGGIRGKVVLDLS
jgi:NADPH:quinone reductase-like Zn-dependent oxidoreductase